MRHGSPNPGCAHRSTYPVLIKEILTPFAGPDGITAGAHSSQLQCQLCRGGRIRPPRERSERTSSGRLRALCHPERSEWFAKRSIHEVEGPRNTRPRHGPIREFLPRPAGTVRTPYASFVTSAGKDCSDFAGRTRSKADSKIRRLRRQIGKGTSSTRAVGQPKRMRLSAAEVCRLLRRR
jgi:hypothetical protein